MWSKCSVRPLFAAGADNNSPVIHQLCLAAGHINRGFNWKTGLLTSSSMMDAQDIQIIAVRPHIDQGEDVMEGAEEGFLCSCSAFRPALNRVRMCVWRVRLPLRQFSQDSQLHPEVGVQWCLRQMCMITDGGVLRVDLSMVQEPARLFFCLSRQSPITTKGRQMERRWHFCALIALRPWGCCHACLLSINQTSVAPSCRGLKEVISCVGTQRGHYSVSDKLLL